jgi:hypothetical protein
MSIRVQVILDEAEAIQFRSQARKESKSLSAWLRNAGRKMLSAKLQSRPLTDPASLRTFFQECKDREQGPQGPEQDWVEQKRLIIEGFQAANRP